jgi:protein subunit release factor A
MSEDNRERVRILSLKDLEVSYFCGSGAGGQARNKVASGVQMRHLESGAIGRASDSRSQDQNRRAAFERLVKDPRMKFWLAQRVYEVKMNESIEQTVERECSPENCRFEIQRDGKWVEVPFSHFDTAEAMESQ